MPSSPTPSSATDTAPPPGRWTFDHVNLAAGSDTALRRLFEGVMGMAPGYRPPFPFPGTWLYPAGLDQAQVHVVQDDRLAQPTGGAVRFAHVAFRTDEAACAVMARVRASDLPFEVAGVPNEPLRQIFVQLPGGFVVELIAPDADATPAG